MYLAFKLVIYTILHVLNGLYYILLRAFQIAIAKKDLKENFVKQVRIIRLNMQRTE